MRRSFAVGACSGDEGVAPGEEKSAALRTSEGAEDDSERELLKKDMEEEEGEEDVMDSEDEVKTRADQNFGIEPVTHVHVTVYDTAVGGDN